MATTGTRCRLQGHHSEDEARAQIVFSLDFLTHGNQWECEEHYDNM